MATLTHPPKGVLSCAVPGAVVCRIRRHDAVTGVPPHGDKLDVSPAAACALTSCDAADATLTIGAMWCRVQTYTVIPTPPRRRRGQSRRPASLDHTRRHARLFDHPPAPRARPEWDTRHMLRVRKDGGTRGGGRLAPSTFAKAPQRHLAQPYNRCHQPPWDPSWCICWWRRLREERLDSSRRSTDRAVVGSLCR
jgi:hypothetical protein